MNMASLVVQLAALSSVPANSLCLRRPPPLAARPRMRRRHGDGNAMPSFALPRSSEGEVPPAKANVRIKWNYGDIKGEIAHADSDPGSATAHGERSNSDDFGREESTNRDDDGAYSEMKGDADELSSAVDESSSAVDESWAEALPETRSPDPDVMIAENDGAHGDIAGRDARRGDSTSAYRDRYSLSDNDYGGDGGGTDAGIETNGDADDLSGAVDELWTGALGTPADDAPSGRGGRGYRPPNPRMRMFAYLSQPVVEVRIIGLVAVSCFLQAIDTLDDLPSVVRSGIHSVENVFVIIFAVEFFLRWWSAGRFRFKYLAKPLASIDAIVVILPLFLSGLLPIWDFGVMTGMIPYVSLPGWLLSFSANSGSALLNLRLLRLLKFQRVLTDKNTYANFQMALGMRKTDDVRPYQLQVARTVTSIFTLVSVSTGLIYTAEHEVNPAIPDYFTALYFGLTTLTTVGFGDITPQTFQGRLVVGGTILAGVAIIPAQAASLAEAYLDFQKERSSAGGGRRREPVAGAMSKDKCEKCGAEPHRNDASFCWSCGEALD